MTQPDLAAYLRTIHYERHVSWLVAAGLRDVNVQVFSANRVPGRQRPDRAALPRTSGVARAAAVGGRTRARGRLSDVDLAEVEELLTPGSPRYVLDESGYYLVHPTILATGRR